jgi:hypothetical protein
MGLGGDVRFQFVPGAGVPIRDRYQARIIEALLPVVHLRWKRLVEVVVQRPVRGVIDFVLHDPDEPAAVASEVQSVIKRVEQQLRWQASRRKACAPDPRCRWVTHRFHGSSCCVTRRPTIGSSRPSARRSEPTTRRIPSSRCAPSRQLRRHGRVRP